MGTEFEASNPYDSESLARLRKRFIIENINRAHTADFDEYYDRTGEMPTSSAQLWETAPRHSDHNPPTDGRQAALDVPLRGWCAPPDDMSDLYSYAQRERDAYAEKLMYMDGMWDLPAREIGAVGLPVIGPGEWTVGARDDFAAVYAAVDPGNDDTGEWESYKACQPDGFGGYWMVDVPPIDPVFARLVVEDAMGRIGMNPRRRTDG